MRGRGESGSEGGGRYRKEPTSQAELPLDEVTGSGVRQKGLGAGNDPPTFPASQRVWPFLRTGGVGEAGEGEAGLA